jgi:hypothetical protein
MSGIILPLTVTIADGEGSMKISDSERLTLFMLCGIWDRLEVGDSVDTKLIREAIHTGNTWAIADTHPGILASPDESEFVEEVGHVLQMWERLEDDFEELTAQEKERVLQEVGDRCFFLGSTGITSTSA